MAERGRSQAEREQIKRLLTAEAELHRAVLRTEYANARALWESLTRLSSTGGWIARLRHKAGAWAVASAAAGWWAVRGRRHLSTLLPALYALWRWWRKHGASLIRSRARTNPSDAS